MVFELIYIFHCNHFVGIVCIGISLKHKLDVVSWKLVSPTKKLLFQVRSLNSSYLQVREHHVELVISHAEETPCDLYKSFSLRCI